MDLTNQSKITIHEPDRPEVTFILPNASEQQICFKRLPIKNATITDKEKRKLKVYAQFEVAGWSGKTTARLEKAVDIPMIVSQPAKLAEKEIFIIHDDKEKWIELDEIFRLDDDKKFGTIDIAVLIPSDHLGNGDPCIGGH
jgi:hypothetical protein